MTDETAVGTKNPASDDEIGRPAPPRDESGDPSALSEQQQLADNRHRDKLTELEFGWLGTFFGGKHAGGNIAGVMSILCGAGIVVLIIVGISTGKWENVDTGIGVLGATLTACLGYLFGRK